MNTCTSIDQNGRSYSAGNTRPTPLFSAVKNALAALRGGLADLKANEQLSRLSNHILTDIGVQRSDVEAGSMRSWATSNDIVWRHFR